MFIEPTIVADLILAAPAWARIGITMPKEELRKSAASEIATVIVDRLERGTFLTEDRDQLSLSL